MEASLERSEAKYRGLVEQSIEGVALLDGSGSLVECNAAIERLSGKNRVELAGLKVWDILFELLPAARKTQGERASLEASWLKAAEDCELQGPLKPFEVTIAKRDDSSLVLEQTLFPIRTRSGSMRGLILRDVTEQREASEALMRTLREKETLLQEVHHRVKNNLQIICSLFHLESSKDYGSGISPLSLVDMEARVVAMSLVHEQLYQSEDFAKVDFRAYVESLCSHLASAYSGIEGRINMAIRVEDVSLTMNQAIPCGLAINELVVNSLKHAFPDGRRGTIAVSMREEGGTVVLEVGDDGIGSRLSPSEIKALGSVGLNLVSSLASQLFGSFEIEISGGFRGRLCFPA